MIDLSSVTQAIASRSPDERQHAAEAMRNAVLSLRELLYQRLLTERNELALVSILQTIQMLDVDEEIIPLICDVAEKDRRPLVRAAAIYALGGRSQDGFLESRLLAETHLRVRAEILMVLYAAGKHRLIAEILRLIRSNDYQTQCAIINGLAEITIPRHRKLVIKEIRSILKGEVPVAVVSTAQRALEDLGG